MALTEKQENYCRNYVVCGNQSAAYRIAYDADSMNSNTVAVEACKLHADPNISIRIKELQQDVWERNKIVIDELIHSLAGMVRFDPATFYEDNGSFRSIHNMPLETRQMITEMTVFEEFIPDGAGGRELIGYTKKVKSIDKLAAIEKLMKHLGGYEKDNKQKSVIGINISGQEAQLGS